MFFTVAAAFSMSSRNAGEFQFLHVPLNTWLAHGFHHCHLVDVLNVGPVALISRTEFPQS